MSAKKIAWVVGGILAVIVLLTFLARTAPTEEPAPNDSSPSATAQKRERTEETTTSPAASTPPPGEDNAFVDPDPTGPQAVEQPTGVAPTHKHQNVVQPKTPTPDQQDPEAVAKAWLTIFNSRTSEQDQGWKTTGKPWLTEPMLQGAADMGNQGLKGRYPAAVSKIEVKEPVEAWGPDTPIRWAHYVEVTVKTEDHGTMLLKYRIREQLAEQGWMINASPLDSWQTLQD